MDDLPDNVRTELSDQRWIDTSGGLHTGIQLLNAHMSKSMFAKNPPILDVVHKLLNSATDHSIWVRGCAYKRRK